MCGEQSRARGKRLFAIGSPPRVRGTVVHKAHKGIPDRITPACAGNSVEGVEKLVVGWDHPRVCGEQMHYTFSTVV